MDLRALLVDLAADDGHVHLGAVLGLYLNSLHHGVHEELVALQVSVSRRLLALQLLLRRRNNNVGLDLLSLDLRQHLCRVRTLLRLSHLLHERLNSLRVNFLPELGCVHEALKRRHLRQGVAELRQVNQRVVRPIFLNRLHLKLHDRLKTHEAHLVRPTAQRNVHHHVHGAVPTARINRHELITKTNYFRLVLVLHDKLEQPLEAPLEAVREDPRDHLDAVLRGGQLRLHRRPRGGLQNVSVQTLRRAADARALRLHLVQIRHDAQRLLADERLRKRLHHARRTGADDCASFDVHHIVNVNLPLNHHRARMDSLRKAVQRVAHDRGLDELQIHRLVGNRLAEDRVRRGIRLKQRVRRRLHNLVMQNVATITNRADLVHLSDAVAVLVDADIRLDIEHLVRRLVGRSRNAKERLVSRVARDDFVVHLEAAGTGVHLNRISVVAHRHQIRDCHQTAAGDDQSVFNALSFIVDQELLRRNALDNVARRHDNALDPQRDLLLTSHHVGFFHVLLNLNVRVVRNKSDLGLCQAGVGIVFNALVIELVPRQDAGLEDQSVLDGVMQNTETVVLLHEDVVNQVGCLFSRSHVL